ncbi:DUF429 domain-containing protein (plasmid) [Haloferax larsenii]|uniref:DUF429 domain-containing protein n=1 Tax=Haloferax larsenii TaxID=302484 RepID=A0ABY5RKI9_HALLR|nr:DUF429 domain-containing protein [Haloferax larsenii]UVE51968.1 DUF429 domain-containing protein [Haloferax larsenii]
MTSYLGVDWADGCWVVVEATDEPIVTTEPSIFNVWQRHGERADIQSILVDIPIGLPESGTRACDNAAKEFLSSRSSTVFTIPPRNVVETDDYETARKCNDNSLGSQSWWLFPRILEVDVFLQENAAARNKIYESHPEICYASMSEGKISPRSDVDGIVDRVEILKEATQDSELLNSVYTKVRKCVENRLGGVPSGTTGFRRDASTTS